MGIKFINNLTEDEFLKKYWNKKPLLIKNAVNYTDELGSFKEFIEISQDSEFETRIVYEKGGDYPWQAKDGPFALSDFKKNALWTLMVHNLDLINSDFFDLSTNINFIPRWHFDDIMATISVKGASVGAHVDDYSVFILQGSGKRKWLLQENPKHNYFPNLDIRLLEEFHPNIEWILEPGDMIYIPPHVAHHGITLEESVSYSLGFKSIRYKDLLDIYVTEAMVKMDEASFHDLKMPRQKESLEVLEYVTEKVRKEILKDLNDPALFQKSLLKYLSRPKNEIVGLEEILTPEKIKKELLGGLKLKRDIWSKFVMTKLNGNQFNIGICGNVFCLKNKSARKLEKIFLSDTDTEFNFSKEDLKDNELLGVLFMLIENGVFYFV